MLTPAIADLGLVLVLRHGMAEGEFLAMLNQTFQVLKTRSGTNGKSSALPNIKAQVRGALSAVHHNKKEADETDPLVRKEI